MCLILGTELEVVGTAEVKESIMEEELQQEGAEGSTETSEFSTEQQTPLATVSGTFQNPPQYFRLICANVYTDTDPVPKMVVFIFNVVVIHYIYDCIV